MVKLPNTANRNEKIYQIKIFLELNLHRRLRTTRCWKHYPEKHRYLKKSRVGLWKRLATRKLVRRKYF